jgi:hypothetical protein
MKNGALSLCDYTLDKSLSIGALEAGLYTLYVVNQNRDYFKIIIVAT